MPLDQHGREPGQQLGGGRPHLGRLDQAEPDGVLVGLVRDALALHHDRAGAARPRRRPRRPGSRRPPGGHRHAVRAQQLLARRPRRAPGRRRPPARRGPATGRRERAPPRPGRSRPRPRPPPWQRAGGASTASPAGPTRPPARRPGCRPSRPPARPARRRGAGRGERGDRRPPVVVRAAVGARQVGEQQVEVRRSAHHGRERVGHRLRLAPDVGVVVERVGQRHPPPSTERSCARCPLVSSAKRTARPTAASAISAASPPELLSELSRVPGSGPPQCSRQSAASSASTEPTWPIPLRRRKLRAGLGVARQRGGVGDHRPAGLLAAAQHQRDQADPALPRAGGQPLPPAQVRERLHDQPERGDPLRRQQRLGDLGHADLRGVADGDDGVQRQPDVGHGHADRDRRRLGRPRRPRARPRAARPRRAGRARSAPGRRS